MSVKREPLKVGDRVAVYGQDGNGNLIRRKATVEKITDTGALHLGMGVIFKEGSNGYDLSSVHPKQCRRLRPKPKRVAREWWIRLDNNGLCPTRDCLADNVGYFDDKHGVIVHVREVLP